MLHVKDGEQVRYLAFSALGDGSDRLLAMIAPRWARGGRLQCVAGHAAAWLGEQSISFRTLRDGHSKEPMNENEIHREL